MITVRTIAATLLLSLPAIAASAAVPTISVGKNVQVSTSHPNEAHYETHAAAHPTDPSKLLATAIIYAKDTRRATVVYASTDGGKTWSESFGPKGLVDTGDPAVAYGPDGTGYFATLTGNGHPLQIKPEKPAHAWDGRKTLLYRLNAGATKWEGPVTMRFADRQYLAFDNTKGKFDGHIYMTGDPRPLSGFAVFTSKDGGKSFSDPGAESDHRGISVGNAVVTSNGILVGVYADSENVRVARSTNGGDSFEPSIVVEKFVRAGSRKDRAHNNVNHFLHMAIDASKGPHRDTLYIVWPDRRSGQGEILFSSSTDKGLTWSPARTVTDNPPTDQNDRFMPTVAVNRYGVLGILWYDRRDNPDNRGYYARFAASVDGGKTWAPSVRLSEAPFTAGEVAKKSAFAGNGGDTAGLAVSADGHFHPVWVHDVDGMPQVFTADVAVTVGK